MFLTLLYPHAAGWSRLASGFSAVSYGAVSWVLSLFAAGVLASGLRDLMAARRLAR